MASVIEAIRTRRSVRAYASRKIEEDTKRELTDCLGSIHEGPFGSSVRFQLVEVADGDTRDLKRLGTYGMIRGATLYVAGAVKLGEKAMEDYGYCMERIVLKATGLGIGTCWLGGSLNRSSFADRIGLKAGEVVPAVSPLGYPGDKSSALVTVLGMKWGNRNRKSPEALFFMDSIKCPLEMTRAGPFQTVLESVRLAPSASNRQPWRIVLERSREAFHFFIDEDRIYNSVFGAVKMQNIDMGIAMCHFALAAQALSLEGHLTVERHPPVAESLRYIASWLKA